jgi:hypothetical protein
MKLLKTITCRFLGLLIGILIFSSLLFAETILTDSGGGLKITQPQQGTIVHPGDEITVTVERVRGFRVAEGLLTLPDFAIHILKDLPITVSGNIPVKAVGRAYVSVFARDAKGNFVADDITLIVEQTAEIVELITYTDSWYFKTDWDGDVNPDDFRRFGGADALYSDGIKREIPIEDLTFLSSSPSVASVDSEGTIKPQGLGEATITIASGNVTADIIVRVEKPSGIRPKETIPPVTTIDIQPPANAAGWHNKDVTITITATDNESGSGVQEIYYEFPYISAQSQRVIGAEAVISFSNEGVNMLRYVAYDNERNSSGQQVTELHIDKTPPTVTLTAEPSILWPSNNTMVEVTINGEAKDKLSGIASVTFKVIDEYGKVQPVIRGFGSTIKLEASRKEDDSDGRTYTITATAEDKAGNIATATATVTVPHDIGKEKGN